jgi:hypothetical protein
LRSQSKKNHINAVVEVDEPIDKNALEAWLEENGYKALSLA